MMVTDMPAEERIARVFDECYILPILLSRMSYSSTGQRLSRRTDGADGKAGAHVTAFLPQVFNMCISQYVHFAAYRQGATKCL